MNTSKDSLSDNALSDVESEPNDILAFNKIRAKNLNNPCLVYYNINSLRNKFNDLKEIFSKSLPDILVFAETKIDNHFSNSQFLMENYFEPSRKDKTKNSGGIIEYIRKGIIRKRLESLELIEFESIASEITISKQKFYLLSFYRTERLENKLTNIKKFIQELYNILNKVTQKYDNMIIMGDINIDLHDKKATGFKEFKELMDTFGLKNIIKDKTCFFRENESSIDCILTNNSRKFFNSSSFELGVSDCHKCISTFLKVQTVRKKTKIISYRSLKNLKQEAFLADLSMIIKSICYDTSDTAINSLSNILIELLDRHAPIKRKFVRGNHSRFMNKELSKAIMKRSKLKSRYLKNKTPANREDFKKQRNLCVKLRDKAIKEDFEKAFSGVNTNSKPFYDIMKPYLTNKGACCDSDIILLENDNIITEDENIANIFVEYYTNIIKHTTGIPPMNLEDNLPPGTNTEIVIEKIINHYASHSSIKSIKDNLNNTETFKFKCVNEREILNTLKKLDSKKAIGIDGIPSMILKLTAEIIAKPLTKIINQSISENSFPTLLKKAMILPFFKKDERSNKKNYRPVSVLSALSKVFGKILQSQIIEFIDNKLSMFITAYRKGHSTQHVLIRLIEEWKKGLDNDKFVGSIIMDLSKAFDCIPHDLLIAKLHAYGFQLTALKYVYSYLKGRRQCVKVNGVQSKFMTMLAGVPQGSILGPILFNIFINDFYYYFDVAKLHGFADDNILSGESKELEDLKSILNAECKIALNWLENNKMLANPSKFQAIIMSKSKESVQTSLNIDGKIVETKQLVEILGVEIDDNLKFSPHINSICSKAGGQLNSLFRFNRYLTLYTKKL